MACSLSGYEKRGVRLALLLLVLLSPVAQAAGLRSPAAVAQAFAAAYRGGDADAIVALQFFVDDSREQERRAWLRQMRDHSMRSYRLAPLLAQDQALLAGLPLPPRNKLVVEYESQQQQRRIEAIYLIGWQGGAYYLLPGHHGR